MKIELIKLRLPLITPFKVSFGVFDAREPVLVKITTDDGVVGYGECASFKFPTYVADYTAAEWVTLRDILLPMVKGKGILDPEEFKKVAAEVKGHNFAKAGVECALWDIKAQKEGKSLSELFGGKRKAVGVGESVGIQGSVEATLEKVAEAIEHGFKRIKVKIEQGWDLEVTEAIRKKYPEVPLMLDGNSDYDLSHVDLFKELDQYELMMIEQPLAYNDIVDHAVLQKEIKTPICLDESVLDYEDARKAKEIGACEIINIKPGRVGGPLETMKIHDYSVDVGMPVWCGGLLETGIGRAFNIALAAKENFVMPGDISETGEFYHEDVVNDPYKIVNGMIEVSQKSGLGYEVNEKRVEKYSIEKINI